MKLPAFSSYNGDLPLFAPSFLEDETNMESFSEVWKAVCDHCIENGSINTVGYNTWLSAMKPIKMENGVAIFSVRVSFQRTTIEQNYFSKLLPAFEEIVGFPVQIHIVSEDEQPVVSPEKAALTKNLKKSYDQAKYEYTFDTFIVGASNKFAHAAALAVASNPANAYNPLFIYGNSGLGKTHLLKAIHTEILNNKPDCVIIYTKGEEFTSQFISSLGNGTASTFQEKYRMADVLLIDDIQFISGKKETQVSFFHIFEKLYEDHKQIVLTSDRPPREIQALDERLRSRFEWGLVADIAPPDFETRFAIVKRKADLLDIELSDEVINFIANKLKTNIRQLEGTVKRLKAYQTLENRKPSLQLAQTAIRDMLTDVNLVINDDDIIMEVARTFNVTPADIVSKKRQSNISLARQVTIHVMKEVSQHTLKTIGEVLGGRDHSTIIYSNQQVEEMMKRDPTFKATVQDIITNLKQDM